MGPFDVSAAQLTQGASDVATNLIREAIVSGRLKPGERLQEERLARELQISRTPIREALRHLQTEGLVEVPRNKGARVSVYNDADLDDIYQLRALLEGFAARRAATRITAPQLDELRASCTRYAEIDPNETQELLQENDHFHNVIVDAADSELLRGMLRQVIVISRAVYSAFAAFSTVEHRESTDDHRRLIKALADGDGERAEHVIREHVLQARDRVLPYVRAPREKGRRGAATPA
jgi:DNA-binding GntR family transcriptional regulator